MNGYFSLFINEQGTYVCLYPPTDGGQPISMNELRDYLMYKNVSYDLKALNAALISLKENSMFFLSQEKRYPERELFFTKMSPDKMEVSIRFYAPSNGGSLMSKEEILRDLNYQKIVFGIDEKTIDQFVENRQYCTDIVVARGLEPVHGKDANIEYYFTTDIKTKPTLQEDGSVDFFNLNTVNHCKSGDVLARLFKEDPGTPGRNVVGDIIKPRDVKKLTLKFGRNIAISEDRQVLTSMVNGHVVLVEDKVFVSDVYEVENVDNSTGNIDYDGSVKVRGNVCTNFSLKASGNIEIAGVVECAYVEAGGDIIIARGMNGVSKGVLKAGGNIVSKFIENANVMAEGYIQTESILHSKVMAKQEVIVTGKRAFITGGVVSATNQVTVKTLGSAMGAPTTIEVGIDPSVKLRYQELQKQVREIQQTLKQIQPLITSMTQKLQQGIKITPEQLKNLQSLAISSKQKQEELDVCMKEINQLEEILEASTYAQVIVTGEVFPGTKIGVSDVSMIVKTNMKHCRFIKSKGDVLMTSI